MTADPHGLDVIDHATALITALITAQFIHAGHVVQARSLDPTAHPEYGPDITLRTIATRAVGDLLKAGLLVVPLTPAELAEMRRQNQRTRGGT